jgi:hypothetical protein
MDTLNDPLLQEASHVLQRESLMFPLMLPMPLLPPPQPPPSAPEMGYFIQRLLRLCSHYKKCQGPRDKFLFMPLHYK